jgi:hypothetical protein
LIYGEATDNEYLKSKVFQYEGQNSDIPAIPGWQNPIEHWALWTVARTDVQAQKRGKLEDEAEDSYAVQLMKGMTF